MKSFVIPALVRDVADWIAFGARPRAGTNVVGEDGAASTENLLARISLATPPPPVGRTAAAYVYEPEPERVREPRSGDGPADVGAEELGERVYEVRQVVDGRSVVRHTTTSLFGATDFALDLQACSHDGEIELVRARGETREPVLRLRPAHPADGSEAARSLLELFGHR